MRLASRKVLTHGFAVLFLLSASGAAFGQADQPIEGTSQENSIPITSLISTVAKKSGKKFVIDPRVRSDVTLIEARASAISYADLLTVLQIHGFAAVESGDLVRIVPDAIVRQMSLPIVRGKEKHFDAEYVTKIIAVRTTPAALLVPMLRPLLPQQAHLAAAICSNDLLIVDTAGNVKRIEALVHALDRGSEPFKPEQCAMTVSSQ